MENETKQSGFGIASLVLGIVGMLLSCVVVGIVPCVIGLILAIVGLTRKNTKQGTAIAGLVCSIIGIVIFLLAVVVFGGNDEEKVTSSTTNVASTEGGTEQQTEEQTEQQKENAFNVGDIVETSSFRITYVTAEQYHEENEFMQPKDGYEYWRFEFIFENISDSDQTVSSMMDWECYADNSKADQAWIGDENGLSATLSSGRTTQGAVYFEIPEGAESIELEYDISFWQSDKIIFLGK